MTANRKSIKQNWHPTQFIFRFMQNEGITTRFAVTIVTHNSFQKKKNSLKREQRRGGGMRSPLCLSVKSDPIVSLLKQPSAVFVAGIPLDPIYAKYLRVTRIYLTCQFCTPAFQLTSHILKALAMLVIERYT